MFKRKNYVINKEFQYGLIATFLLIVVCSLLLFTVVFIAYSYLRDSLGENAYNEFYQRSYREIIRIQVLEKNNFVKPKEFAEKIKNARDPVSAFIRENLPSKTIMQYDYTDQKIDELLQQDLAKTFNQFLENTIKNYPTMEPFYNKERFKGLTLPQDLEKAIQSKIDPQSAAMYEWNLQLLAYAYPDDLKIAPRDSGKFINYAFQKIDENPKKLYEISLVPLIINNLILMLIIIVVGIFYSHRIAGPIYRLEQDIMRVLSGERNVQIKLRKKDKLKTLAEQINKLINELDKHRGN